MKQIQMNKNHIVGSILLLIGCIANYFGDRLLGVHFELFYGIWDFGFLWVIDLFVLPLVIGFAVSAVYGFGGKWIAFFVPLLSHAYSYYSVNLLADAGLLPQGAVVQPIGWWGFFVIVAMEVALVGGVFGEAMIKKTYGRRPRHLVYKQKDSVGKSST